MEVELIQPIAMDQGLTVRDSRGRANRRLRSRYRGSRIAVITGPLGACCWYGPPTRAKGPDNCKTYDQGAALDPFGAAPSLREESRKNKWLH